MEVVIKCFTDNGYRTEREANTLEVYKADYHCAVITFDSPDPIMNGDRISGWVTVNTLAPNGRVTTSCKHYDPSPQLLVDDITERISIPTQTATISSLTYEVFDEFVKCFQVKGMDATAFDKIIGIYHGRCAVAYVTFPTNTPYITNASSTSSASYIINETLKVRTLNADEQMDVVEVANIALTDLRDMIVTRLKEAGFLDAARQEKKILDWTKNLPPDRWKSANTDQLKQAIALSQKEIETAEEIELQQAIIMSNFEALQKKPTEKTAFVDDEDFLDDEFIDMMEDSDDDRHSIMDEVD